MSKTKNPSGDRKALVSYNLLRRQADIVAALLRGLIDDECDWRNGTIESAVADALRLDCEPNEEQYYQGCDWLAAIATRLKHRGNGRYRLEPDEARLLAGVLDGVLRSTYDWDFRIENAVVSGLNLDDAPNGRQYAIGEWAIEQARVRLNEPTPRPPERPGDLLQIEFDDEIDGLAANAYEIVALSDDSLTVKNGEDDSLRVLSREQIESVDAWVDRRFVSSPADMAEPASTEPQPVPDPWRQQSSIRPDAGSRSKRDCHREKPVPTERRGLQSLTRPAATDRAG